MATRQTSAPCADARAQAGFLRAIRRKAGEIAYASPLYNWSLGGCVPGGLAMHPIDVWPGDVDRARWLCGGSFEAGGEHVGIYGDFWEPIGAGPSWMEHLHSFEWLRDLKALGGDQGRRMARALVESWVARYPRWHPEFWSPPLAGRRIALWLALYDFFGESADDSFQADFLDSLVRQARHLSRCASTGADEGGLGALYAAKGILYAGVALAGFEQWIGQGLDIIEEEIGRQILTDGGHVSRSPENLARALQLLIDVRGTLLAAQIPTPEKIQHAIDKMSPALRFFRYPDKGLALFNGAQEGDRTLIDGLLVHANARGKALKSLSHSGFERVTQGKSVLILDCGGPPAPPADRLHHAAPLAFEFFSGRERIFVNCGSHPTSEEWRDALRGTAAHTALGIASRNAFEVQPDGHIGRRARAVSCEREETADACLLDASHDGYVPLNGITHRRRLYLAESGGKLCGEDNLACAVGISKSAEVAVRFHLHPRINVSLVQDGKGALLVTPGGTGWRFFHNGGELALEDSVYLGSDSKPRKTRQLAIYGAMESDFAQIKWCLSRES